jgi:CDP-glucose 4,6-dehydratase
VSASSRFAGVSVLVTGAQGFIGSWLAERLLAEGAHVVVPRRDAPADSRFRLEGIEAHCDVVDADVSDLAAMSRVLSEYEVRFVFHLAAQTIVGQANRSPLATFEANVRGTYTLLEACRREDGVVEGVVVASSDKAYGTSEELPYREDHPLNAIFPYDVSKACTDLIARSFAATYAMPVAVTRLANVYGPGDMNFSRVVPDTARALAEGRRPVIRSDGTPQRDYLYVADAVEAYLAVAGSLDRPELHGRAWNAGPGEPVSVLDLVQRLVRASGRSLEPDVQGKSTPAGEIVAQWLNASAIRDELGWAPWWSLDAGLAEAWRWYERALTPAGV